MENDPISKRPPDKRPPEGKGISALDKLRLAGVLALAILPGCDKIGDIKEYRQIVNDTFPKVGLSVRDTVVTKTLSKCGESGSIGVVDKIHRDEGTASIIFVDIRDIKDFSQPTEPCKDDVSLESIGDIITDR